MSLSTLVMTAAAARERRRTGHERPEPSKGSVSLDLRQSGDRLEVAAVLSGRRTPTALAVVAGEREVLRVGVSTTTTPDGVSVSASLSLPDVLAALVDGRHPPAAGPALVKWVVEPPGGQERLVLVGRAAATTVGDVPGIRADGHRLRPFLGRKGFLRIAVDADPPLAIESAVLAADLRDGRLLVSGRLESHPDAVLGGSLVVVGRSSGQEHASPLDLRPQADRNRASYGTYHYTFSARQSVADWDWTALPDTDIYDLALDLELGSGVGTVRRILGPSERLARGIRPDLVGIGSTTLAITPYHTFKVQRLAMHIDRFPTAAVRRMRSGRVPRPAKPVWLVGELPHRAQESGLQLFRYLREQHREIDAYYVIRDGSPDRRHLDGLDHVLIHGSPEHVEKALQAERIVSTHHPQYLYPTRHPVFTRRARALRVFLGHGIMGPKWMAPNYGKDAPDFAADLMFASSERERRIMIDDLGYAPDEVVVTGLARHDALVADDVPRVRGQILVMPTWRDWLGTDRRVETSEFVRRWRAFLEDPRLAEAVSAGRASIVFVLHPNTERFAHVFADSPATVADLADVDVQTLLKQSDLMVTDYTSAAFDFAVLRRPVVYYQFDRERFLAPAGSHLDLDAELPGTIVTTHDDAVQAVLDSIEAGHAVSPEAVRRAERLITHRDGTSRERTVAAIRRGRRDGARPSPRQLVAKVVNRVERALKGTRWFVPAMRTLMWVARRLPVDRELIVFEAGLGRRYGDSPRYLYEELLRRGDQRRKVWVYAGPHRFPDPRTTTVRRVSLRYFWALGRAGTWVSDQNLPFYVRRRRSGIFLQTWHGTPLKRMLHDLDKVVGRDEGYMSRVDTAVRQWTHLLSQSPSATAWLRSAFEYSGEVVEQGYPRNDPLIAPDRDEVGLGVRTRLGLRPGQPVVLYAPTFRDDQGNGKGRFTFELPFDLDRLVAALPEDGVLLLRMHVLISNRLAVPEHLAGRVIDVSSYPNIQELYLAADALVTDYSSVFFDYALLRRPIVFYAPDLASYRDDVRGFYLDYERDLPGPVTMTEDDLGLRLREALEHGVADPEAHERFVRAYAPLDDGSASARVVDAVLTPRR